MSSGSNSRKSSRASCPKTGTNFTVRSAPAALTEHGVLKMAETIAKKRETMRELSILLETHLGDAAAAVIDSLFALVEVQS